MPELRFGVIGVGQIGRLRALNLASHIPGATLCAACDLNPARLSGLPIRALYEDHEVLLATADIDAVAICTPGDTHAEIIEAAANAGKHIFCEKPLDLDLSKADRALAAVDRAGVKLQIGLNRRFDAEFARARKASTSRAIGAPLTLHIISHDPASQAADNPADLFLDTTIHDLDMARFLIGGEATSIHATGSRRGQPNASNPDTALTTLTFANGAVATIDNTRLADSYDQRLELIGTQATARVENVDVTETSADARPFFIQRYADSYVAELSAFVDCVLNDTPPPVTGHDGRAALTLALAAQRSYREGHAVRM